MTTIRTAVFGYGLGGRVFHAPFIHADPGYSLDVIVTSDPARKAEAEVLYPGVLVVPTAQDAFARAKDLDLAVISTPPGTHAPLATDALNAGLAVVVDKPFVIDTADGVRLIELARSRGSVLTVFQNRRWDGDFLTVRKLVDEGLLGSIRRFESRMESFKPVLSKPWKGAPAGDGGGILYDLGPHLIDQALTLFGPAELQYAELAAHRGDGGPDDDAFLALRHANGTISHLWMNALAPQAAPRFRVVGSTSAYSKWGVDVQEPSIVAGMLPTDPLYGVEDELAWGLLGFDADATKVRTEKGQYPRFYELMASAMLHGTPPPVDPQDSVAALRIIEATHQE
ncbi:MULTISPECIES: Gfo/Idh/MocA family oxidoreductase [unclassified Arthrobacter]|uniref:Gfo/Idh/MocA family protein n=1 Tax=unclassified Arthrobacter TaxID=235627 RepID=UPI0014913B35|nr:MULTISPECIES: Gfo/Idh/MocA family oxidoreductase [unclassified Arthrobacter]MBE0010424.1 oxidoreductase [Arthrobacter sp. AET 35A]NOJ64253.1 Gfo/Idh/MocA family oxidoreductase [Arthrobacter sp. 147(2020)]